MNDARRKKILWADVEDLEMAKKIAAMQGISLNKYFKQKVKEDIPLIKKSAEEIDKKYRGGDRFGNLPF